MPWSFLFRVTGHLYLLVLNLQVKWPNGIEYDGDWKAESAESAESGNVKS